MTRFPFRVQLVRLDKNLASSWLLSEYNEYNAIPDLYRGIGNLISMQ